MPHPEKKRSIWDVSPLAMFWISAVTALSTGICTVIEAWYHEVWGVVTFGVLFVTGFLLTSVVDGILVVSTLKERGWKKPEEANPPAAPSPRAP